MDSLCLLSHYSSKWLNLYYQLYYKNNNYTFSFSAYECNIQLCLTEQEVRKDLLSQRTFKLAFWLPFRYVTSQTRWSRVYWRGCAVHYSIGFYSVQRGKMVGVLPRTHDTQKVTWWLKWGPITRNEITESKSSTVSTVFLHDFQSSLLQRS